MNNSNKPDPKTQIASLYNRVATDYGQIGPKNLDAFGRRLVELAEVSTGARVLDIGSGRGASLMPSALAVDSSGLVTGIDIAFQMVKETGHDCRKAGFFRVSVLQMDGDDLAFRSRSFDFAFCGFAIFFFSQPAQTLREWHRVLAPGGKVGICIAAGTDERWGWYEALLVEYHKRYQFPLSAGTQGLRRPADIAESLNKAGFSKVNLFEEVFEFTYETEDQWWQAKWTHGARFPLERMNEQVLTEFKTEVFEHLERARAEHGLQEKWYLAYVIGEKEKAAG